MHHIMHTAFTSIAILGPTILSNEGADMVTGFFRVGYGKDMSAVTSPAFQTEQNDANKPTATIPRVWLAPVREHARAVNRMARLMLEDRGAVIQNCYVAVLSSLSVGMLGPLKDHLCLFATPVKLITLKGPPPLKRKGMVEEDDVSEEVIEAFAMWMNQRMGGAASKASY
ncbi:hypothetical protein AX15_003701 [Amanita polypyramis BW_CC]|nr:hypothetical protein AX15_003701 [Amanita polypyramis BW_CC]